MFGGEKQEWKQNLIEHVAKSYAVGDLFLTQHFPDTSHYIMPKPVRKTNKWIFDKTKSELS